jgi:hypothetical protein
METGKRDTFTGQILARASAAPEFKNDFTARVMAQIEADTVARRAKIDEPLLPNRVWRWVGIILSSMVLSVLSLSVLVFGPSPELRMLSPRAELLPYTLLTLKTATYLPQLLLAALICFCWLALDYCYGRLKQS